MYKNNNYTIPKFIWYFIFPILPSNIFSGICVLVAFDEYSRRRVTGVRSVCLIGFESGWVFGDDSEHCFGDSSVLGYAGEHFGVCWCCWSPNVFLSEFQALVITLANFSLTDFVWISYQSRQTSTRRICIIQFRH